MRWRDGLGIAGDIVTLWLGAPLVASAAVTGVGYVARLEWPLVAVLSVGTFGLTMTVIGSLRRRQGVLQPHPHSKKTSLGLPMTAPGRVVPFEPYSVRGTVSKVGLSEILVSEPAVWFEVSFSQASGYLVTIESISGHISIAGRRCNLAPTLERSLEIMSSGGDQVAQVRQPISAELAAEIRTILERDDGIATCDLAPLVLHGHVRLDPYRKADAVAVELRYTTRSVHILGPIRFTKSAGDMGTMIRFETAFGSQTYYDAYGRRKPSAGVPFADP